MKLYVEFIDTTPTEIGLEHLNEACPALRRVVAVELTSDQVKALTPRRVQSPHNANIGRTEDVRLISLQDD